MFRRLGGIDRICFDWGIATRGSQIFNSLQTKFFQEPFRSHSDLADHWQGPETF